MKKKKSCSSFKVLIIELSTYYSMDKDDFSTDIMMGWACLEDLIAYMKSNDNINVDIKAFPSQL